MQTTIGQLLINEALPEDLRDYNRVLTKKDLGKLANQLAEKHPDKYREVMKRLHDVGHEASYTTNGLSMGLKDIKPTLAARTIQLRVQKQLQGILADKSLDDKARNLKILKLASEAQQQLVEDVHKEALGQDNPLAHQTNMKGNKFSLNSIIGADMQYVDHKNEPIPIPVMHGYSQGLRPVEYFAGAFGTRKGVMDLKCLHEDTQVVMGDWSTRAIKDVRPNDIVIGADTTGVLRPVRVLNVFKNGLRACRRWTFRVGATRNRFVDVVATADHKILAQIKAGRPGSTYAYRSQYAPAPVPLGASRPQKNPTKNEFVAWPARGEASAALGFRERRALLFGLLLGDGYIAKKGEIQLSCADQSLVDDITTYLASLNLYLAPPKGNYSWRLLEIVKSPQKRADGGGYATTGNVFKEWLYEHGCRGKKAHEKALPNEVWQWDRDSVCALLAGLIATDGTIEVRKDGCTVKFKTTSMQLVEQTQRLLELRLGVWCTPLRRVPVETIPRGNHDQWEITFSHPEAVRRFAQLVTLPGVKRHQLALGLSRLSAQPRSAEIGFKLYNTVDVGECETYDIEVDHPDHLFLLANGLIVSNSATADAGFFAKQLAQMTHRLLVTGDDDDDQERLASAHERGYPTDVDDVDNEGALLARDVGPYKRNTVLTPKILKDIKEMGVKDLLVRSPMVGGPADGGVFARDVGYREKGRLPPIGDYVGLSAAQAIGEPITQAQISSKHCLAEGTLVRMADWSVKRIEDIRAGDVVLGADKNAQTFPSRVVRTYDNGLRECARTVFRVPYSRTGANVELVSTLDHKVLMFRRVANSLAEADNWTPQVLPVGTVTGKLSAIMPRGFDDRTANLTHEPFALLVGLLLGDGCYTKAVNSVNFSCFDPTLIEEVQPLIAPLNLKLTKLKGHPGYYKVAMRADDYYTRRDSRTGQMLAGTRNPVRQWLESRGMYGKYAHEKRLPEEIWDWDNASVAQLIAGYFMTDGSVFVPGVNAHISKPYLSFGSTSREMLEQVQLLLAQRFGIYSTGPYTNNMARKRTLYNINISAEESIRRFHAVISLYGVKRRTFDELLRNWRVKSPRPFTRYPRHTPEPVGQLPTYDIEVENEDHLFVLANGLIVSNSGGVGGASAIGGFKAINALVQVPKTYPNGATHAQLDGHVQEIREAPQGGQYVQIGGQDHYVPTDRHLSVKKGDTLEAGDVLTDGIPNPAEIVRHKGVGEGRRYFVQTMQQVLKNSGVSAHRRNIELLSRGLINHVRMTDEYGDNVPDEVVPYSVIERNWTPRQGSVTGVPKSLMGHYLERPVLHYSIGTRIGKNVVDNLQKYGINNIEAHKEPPPFQPEMIRGMANISNDPDWMTRMLGSYQEKGLMNSVHRGLKSDTAGSSFVPALARGEHFGVSGTTSGWQP